MSSSSGSPNPFSLSDIMLLFPRLENFFCDFPFKPDLRFTLQSRPELKAMQISIRNMENVTALGHFHELYWLSVTFTPVTVPLPSILEVIQNFPKLRVLFLFTLHQKTIKFMYPITYLHELTVLVSNCPILHLIDAPKLSYLDVIQDLQDYSIPEDHHGHFCGFNFSTIAQLRSERSDVHGTYYITGKKNKWDDPKNISRSLFDKYWINGVGSIFEYPTSYPNQFFLSLQTDAAILRSTQPMKLARPPAALIPTLTSCLEKATNVEEIILNNFAISDLNNIEMDSLSNALKNTTTVRNLIVLTTGNLDAIHVFLSDRKICPYLERLTYTRFGPTISPFPSDLFPKLRDLIDRRFSSVRLSFISSFGLASLVIFVLISSSPVQEHLLVHGEIHTLPQEFQINGAADPQHILTLTIELVSNNMTGLEKELYAVSDPKSDRYGQHLNRSQVDSFVRPSVQASATLNKWLADQGITVTSKSSAENLIKIQVPVKQANSITHIPSNQSMVRAMTYSLPKRLSPHTQGIYPITKQVLITYRLIILPKHSIASPVGKQRALLNATFRRGVDAVQDLYNIPRDTPDQGATGGVGVLTFGKANVKGSEVAKYLQTTRTDVSLSGVQLGLVSISGGDDSQTDFSTGLEGNIDTQMVLGISPHSPVTIYSSSDSMNGLELTDLLNAVGFLSGQSNIPQVIVFNYAILESTEDSDEKIEKAICNAIMELGSQGVSFLATSGDGGVVGLSTNQLNPCSSSNSFAPTFPSTCTYVTSVGSTSFSSGADLEIGSLDSASGFSNVFPRAPYQADSVNGYLKQIGSLYSGRFNASGRGFPDISAITGNVGMVFDGDRTITETTLSSVPIVAAIIADLNAQRQSQGNPPLGFLNPLFYSNPHVFDDITQGNNPGCGTNGFPAKNGWDAITGLGSPNYTALQQIV
ncbi:hypothetical protein Clacol_010466 [Clathrus columnatus]|uniref:Peptidase S53 domain-containing protein n=1 Tax=Clathrus columnatus TaxID=1419009 RepID=A0AAV5ANF6_9AGAM|nr:hypothetical protein Clacol_010466 [Clathrus columnatus]